MLSKIDVDIAGLSLLKCRNVDIVIDFLLNSIIDSLITSKISETSNSFVICMFIKMVEDYKKILNCEQTSINSVDCINYMVIENAIHG